MGEPHLKAALYEHFAEVGRALASPRRLELLDLLAQGERTVDALATVAGLGVTTTSAHLQTLRRAGLVRTRRDGTRVHYALAGDDVADLLVRLLGVARRRVEGTEAARTAYLGPDGGDIHVAGADLAGLAGREDVVVLDVRPAHEFRQGHLPGALSIPVGELAGRLDELPDGATVIVYCRGDCCAFAPEAVRLLRARGIDAVRLGEGMVEWRVAGRPVDTGDAA